MEKITNDYLHELNWDYDFSSCEDYLLGWARSVQHSNWSKTDPKWCIVSRQALLGLPIFAEIDQLVPGAQIEKGVLRQNRLGTWSWAHSECRTGDELLNLSLNIPIRSPEAALHHWYDFSSHPEYNTWDFRRNAIKDDIDRQLPFEQIKDYSLFNTRLTKPAFYNTMIPHSSFNDQAGRSIVLSLQLTPSFSWNQCSLFDNTNPA